MRRREFIAGLGKTIAVAEDFPAFIVNRILLPMINEAIYTLYEGVGGVEAIDTAMKLGANHPMGPLALADFIGLDTCLSVMQVLHDGLADSKYRPCPNPNVLVELGYALRAIGQDRVDQRGEHQSGKSKRHAESRYREALEPSAAAEEQEHRKSRHHRDGGYWGDMMMPKVVKASGG